MSDEQRFLDYIELAHEYRIIHGVRKDVDGTFTIFDFDKFDKVKSWQKDLLRGLGKIKDEEEEHMAIPRNHRISGYIDEVGEYRVKVEQMLEGLSSKNKKMLTVTFVTDDEKRIKGFYVKELKFHMSALKDLKLACGLTEKDPASSLLGKRCGIAVGQQKPNDDGRVFMTIEGYGPEKDAPAADGLPNDIKEPEETDNVPF